MWQSLKALKYMHSAELLHRDMKPSNLLLNSDCLMKVRRIIAASSDTLMLRCSVCRGGMGCAAWRDAPPTLRLTRNVQVADFGLARSLRDQSLEEERDTVLTDYVATRWYRAPEILLGSTRYSFAVDMWSMGCILAEMLQGKPIFPGSSTINQVGPTPACPVTPSRSLLGFCPASPPVNPSPPSLTHPTYPPPASPSTPLPQSSFPPDPYHGMPTSSPRFHHLAPTDPPPSPACASD